MQNELVSVIIPTFNRAHILKKTIHTYNQESVKEIILVDDCSIDNTEEVINLLKKEIKKIKYIKLNKKGYQMGAKNEGMNLASGKYVYFGDDDSVIQKNTIKKMLEILKKYNADIVGIKALYASSMTQIENLEDFIKSKDIKVKVDEIIDLRKMKIDFSKSTSEPVEVPVLQACFLAKKDKIKKIKYDENYKGNCFREETDYILRCKKNGLKIIYYSEEAQVNYPRASLTGGAHTKNKIKWYYYCVVNNYYFLKKNYNYLYEKGFVNRSINVMQLNFLFELTINIIKNLKFNINRRIESIKYIDKKHD